MSRKGALAERTTVPYLIPVWTGKGGVGKSLLSMAFAAITTYNHGTAYMVDIDAQATTAEVAERAEQAGTPLPFHFVAETDPRELAKLRRVRGIDIVFVDCPGSIESVVMDEVLPLADFVVIPYIHDPFMVTPTVRAYEKCQRHGVPAGVLINRVDARRGDAMLDDAIATLDKLGLPRFRSFIREYAAHSLAHVNGQMITQYRGRHAGDAREDIHRAHGELLLTVGGGARGA
jgi:chromosome partitioning protein